MSSVSNRLLNQEMSIEKGITCSYIINKLVSIRSTYTLLKCVIQFLQHASIFISNEMKHEKCFKMMAALDWSCDVTC